MAKAKIIDETVVDTTANTEETVTDGTIMVDGVEMTEAELEALTAAEGTVTETETLTTITEPEVVTPLEPVLETEITPLVDSEPTTETISTLPDIGSTVAGVVEEATFTGGESMETLGGVSGTVITEQIETPGTTINAPIVKEEITEPFNLGGITFSQDVAPVEVIDIPAVVKDDTLTLKEKLETISKGLTGAQKIVWNSMIALDAVCGMYGAHEPTVNSEQRYFARHFIALNDLTEDEFTTFMSYLRWGFKKLSDAELAKEEGRFVFLNGTTGIDPMNSLIFCHDKDESEINTFVILMTIFDTQKDLKESGTTKKSDLSRLNPNHNISEDLLSKLNKFYS